MPKLICKKLVRDRIPEIIERSGKESVTEILDANAYKKLLDTKLGEELQEYLSDSVEEELADLLEVILAILDYKGISYQDFEALRRRKAEERGAFRGRILLKRFTKRISRRKPWKNRPRIHPRPPAQPKICLSNFFVMSSDRKNPDISASSTR